MVPKRFKIAAIFVISCYILLVGGGGYTVNYGAGSNIIMAAEKTSSKDILTSTDPNVTTTKTTKTKVKNSGNKPAMPLMPLMPNNPAESADTAGNSTVLKRLWESGQNQTKSEQLKTQWESRKNSVLSGKSLKIKTNIGNKKNQIHQQAKGKSSKTEIKTEDN